jgi:hypothetical protein
MILHFVRDEKIIDQIIENFTAITSENYFLVFIENQNQVFTHIKKTGLNITVFNTKNDDINNIVNKIVPTAIIIHSLHYYFAKTILNLDKPIPICWIAWGFDVYHLPRIRPKIYGEKTKQFIIGKKPFYRIETIIKRFRFTRKLFYSAKNEKDYYTMVFKSIDRIDYFCSYMKEDYNYLNFHYKNKLLFLYSTFSTIDQYLAGNKDLRLKENANNILIGNSNSLESNYLDVINRLSVYKDEINKAYFTLSYGKNQNHKFEVINQGEKHLGNHFHPLLDFMDRNQYIQLLQSCSAGVFYHYRQQAMGNIIALLYMGARVYLSEKNPAYHYFLRNGILVNCFEKEFDSYKATKPAKNERENNRNKLNLLFNKESVLSDLKALTQTLTK